MMRPANVLCRLGRSMPSWMASHSYTGALSYLFILMIGGYCRYMRTEQDEVKRKSHASSMMSTASAPEAARGWKQIIWRRWSWSSRKPRWLDDDRIAIVICLIGKVMDHWVIWDVRHSSLESFDQWKICESIESLYFIFPVDIFAWCIFTWYIIIFTWYIICTWYTIFTWYIIFAWYIIFTWYIIYGNSWLLKPSCQRQFTQHINKSSKQTLHKNKHNPKKQIWKPVLPRYGFDCRERSWNQRWQYERLRRSSQRCLGWMPSPNNNDDDDDDDDNQCLYNINLLETHLDHEPIIGKVWNVVARFPNVHRHIWLPDNGDCFFRVEC